MEKTISTVEMTIETMDSASQHVPDQVVIPTEKDMKNRLRLEFSELLEKATAMGLEGSFQTIIGEELYDRALKIGAIDAMAHAEAICFIRDSAEDNLLQDTHEVNVRDVLDACVDQRVVGDGTIAAFGFHNLHEGTPVSVFDGAFATVHENNMTKFTTDKELAEERANALLAKGIVVEVVESKKRPGVYALIDVHGKYKKPLDFVSVELDHFIPADVPDLRQQ